MATKKDVEDLRAVLKVLQDDREEREAQITLLRGANAVLTRDLEAAKEDLVDARRELEREKKFAELSAGDAKAFEDQAYDLRAELSEAKMQIEDLMEEECQAVADRERLLNVLGWSELDWEIKKDKGAGE